jgi:hypothetical protein
MAEQHDHTMSRFQRHSILLLVMIAGTAVYFAIERGPHTMSPSAFASSPNSSKPPVDALAPKRIATATFAMG